MASFNKVILMGNLTKDPEVRYLPSGVAVCDLSLAMNETFKNKAGEQVEQTCYVDIVVWARQAETCGEYLRKGSQALVEGRLQLDKWESKEGESRSKLRVRADRVQFLGSPRGEGRGQREDDREPPAERPEPAREPAEAPPPPPPSNDGLEGDDDDLPF